MYKKLIFFGFIGILALSSCEALQKAALASIVKELTNEDVANGLKSALELGIGDGASKLSQKGGFMDSPYRILLPEEARQVTDRLKVIPGFNKVEEIVLEKINAGAEDAAAAAQPIFMDAIKKMTFSDALSILMGEKNAATDYLKRTTYDSLYAAFNPVIVKSLDKYEARKYWSEAVTAYNKIPFIKKANPSLDNYVTTEALKGLFDMVEKKELSIRENPLERTTDLLRKVFAKQDKNAAPPLNPRGF